MSVTIQQLKSQIQMLEIGEAVGRNALFICGLAFIRGITNMHGVKINEIIDIGFIAFAVLMLIEVIFIIARSKK